MALRVSVKLKLIPDLGVRTAIKEVEPAKGRVGQHIEYYVHANPSSLLQDQASTKEMGYLFWEAECTGCSALTDGPFQDMCDCFSISLYSSFLPSQPPSLEL